MDYLVQITYLVRLAKRRQIHCPLAGYKEKHHIVPRAIGKLMGQTKQHINCKENLVYLTAQEHLQIHIWYYLWFKKYYGLENVRTEKIIQGLNRLLIGKPSKNAPNLDNINFLEYEQFRVDHSVLTSKRFTGKHHTEETKRIISNQKIGKKLSENHKKNTSLGLKKLYRSGYINPTKGKKYTKERCDQMRIISKKYCDDLRQKNIPFPKYIHTEEQKNNQSKLMKEKYASGQLTVWNTGLTLSKEICDKKSKSMIEKYKNGFINPNKGKRRNTETIEKLKFSLKQYYKTNKSVNLGKKLSDEQKNEISNNIKNYYKNLSDTERERIRKTQETHKYEIIDKEGNICTTSSLKQFCKIHDIDDGNLGKTINYKNRWAKGFKIISKTKLNIDDIDKQQGIII